MNSSQSTKIYTLVLILTGATVILSPLYVIRWQYFNAYPTTLLELLIWLTAISWLLYKWGIDRVIRIPPATIFLPLAIIFIAATLSLFTAPNLWGAVGHYRAYFLEPIIIFIVIWDLTHQNRPIKIRGHNLVDPPTLIWWSVLALTSWLSVLGISQMLLRWPVFTPHQFDRVHALFNNGNSFALLIGPVIAVLLFDSSLKHRSKLGLLFLLLIPFLGTKSLGGLIALITTWILFSVARHISKNLLLPFLIVTVVGFFIFLSQISAFTPTVNNPWNRPGGTFTVRLCVWEGTAQLIRQHPFWGVGLRGFQPQYSENYYTCDAEPLMYPHNIFLNFWAELGFVGLVGFLWLFAWIFLSTQRFTPFFLYLLIHGLVDVPYFKNDLALIFWVGIALWLAQEVSQHPQPTTDYQTVQKVCRSAINRK